MLFNLPEWLHWVFLGLGLLTVFFWLFTETGRGKELRSFALGLLTLVFAGFFVVTSPDARSLVMLTPHELGAMLVAIPLLPLIGAVFNGLLGKWVGNQRAGFIATSLVVGSFVASMAVLANLLAGATEFHVTTYQWFAAGTFDVHLGLYADHLTGVMLFVVTGISAVIHWYSIGYMEHDPHAWRYFAYLNLFVAAMLLLVLGDNLATLFVGWEGVGLCSYLLIGFWFTDEAKASAGKKAFITNRVGDFGFLIGMFLLFSVFGTLKISGLRTQAGAVAERGGWQAPVATGLFHDVWQRSVTKLKSEAARLENHAQLVESQAALGRIRPGSAVGAQHASRQAATLRAMASRLEKRATDKAAHGPPTYHFLIGLAVLFLFIGATGKSAQIPLYIWLPDAMAGPTPVSALIHAATMVTAGVYMIARLSFLYVHVPEVMAVVAIVGALTALFAALMAFGQNDIKKVLAYSTVSQLGYMFVGVGAGAFAAGTYHLFTHAFFKGLLFLGSGAVIHGLADNQDIRTMGGLRKHMPHTAWTFLIATIAITGVLPFSGFWSKDGILHDAFESPSLAAIAPWLGPLLYIIGTVAAFGTAFYMFRLYYLTFEGEYRGKVHPHEAPPTMTIPLWILAIGSIAAAGLAFPLGDSFWERFLAPAVAHYGPEMATHAALPVWPFAVAVAVAWSGFGLAWLMYGKGMPTPESDPYFLKLPAFAKLTANKFYVDEIYQTAIIKPLWRFAKWLHKWVDAFAIDRVFVNGAAQVTEFFAKVLSPAENGDLSRYAAVTALAVAGLLIWAVV